MELCRTKLKGTTYKTDGPFPSERYGGERETRAKRCMDYIWIALHMDYRAEEMIPEVGGLGLGGPEEKGP